MTHFFLVLFSFLSLSVFAGDLYLVCEDSKNDVLLSSSLSNGKARLVVVLNNAGPTELQLTKVKNDPRSLYKLGITNLSDRTIKEVNISNFEEITLDQFVCAVRD
jgi:hypothetical protein